MRGRTIIFCFPRSLSHSMPFFLMLSILCKKRDKQEGQPTPTPAPSHSRLNTPASPRAEDARLLLAQDGVEARVAQSASTADANETKSASARRTSPLPRARDSLVGGRLGLDVGDDIDDRLLGFPRSALLLGWRTSRRRCRRRRCLPLDFTLLHHLLCKIPRTSGGISLPRGHSTTRAACRRALLVTGNPLQLLLRRDPRSARCCPPSHGGARGSRRRRGDGGGCSDGCYCCCYTGTEFGCHGLVELVRVQGGRLGANPSPSSATWARQEAARDRRHESGGAVVEQWAHGYALYVGTHDALGGPLQRYSASAAPSLGAEVRIVLSWCGDEVYCTIPMATQQAK